MAAYRRAVTVVAGHFKGYQVDHIDRTSSMRLLMHYLGWALSESWFRPMSFWMYLHNPSVKLPTEEDIANPDPGV